MMRRLVFFGIFLIVLESTYGQQQQQPQSTTVNSVSCDVLVVGGSLGGVAAAIESVTTGIDTCFVVESGWIGGQMTSQGVSALDEAFWDTSPTYEAIVQRIRDFYLKTYNPKTKTNAADGKLNPGGCWVSRLCYEPKVAANVIQDTLNSIKKLRIYQGFIPVRAQTSSNVGSENTVTAVAFGRDTPVVDAPSESMVVSAKVTIDATELGEIVNLSGAAFRLGTDSRSQTGEERAPEVGNSECVQPITMGFVLELDDPKKSNKLPKPPRYDPDLYKFGNNPAFGDRSFWQYRRIWSSSVMGRGKDLALINWHYGNDFKQNCGELGCNIVGKTRTQQREILDRAREQGLGFVYWLQNDAPRDGGNGKGYPNLKLREDIMGGGAFSQQPYIRESRRLVGLTTITEGDLASTRIDVTKKYRFRSRTTYADSVGIVRYFFSDIHDMPGACKAPKGVSPPGSGQIPLRAIIPHATSGLLVATGKTLATTHITNGVYRMHSTEWNIGQAAGAAAAFSIQAGIQPRDIPRNEKYLRLLQLRLIAARPASPIYWWGDRHNAELPASQGVMRGHKDRKLWVATQMLGVMGIIPGGPSLGFNPYVAIRQSDAAKYLKAATQYSGIVDMTTGADPATTGPALTKAAFIVALAQSFCRNAGVADACKPVVGSKPVFNDVCQNGVVFDAVQLAARRGWISAGDISVPRPSPSSAKATSFATVQTTAARSVINKPRSKPPVKTAVQPKPAAKPAAAKPKPNTQTKLCAGSLNVPLGVNAPISRGEVAKILWSFVFREKLDRLNLSSVSSSTASSQPRSSSNAAVKLVSDAEKQFQGLFA